MWKGECKQIAHWEIGPARVFKRPRSSNTLGPHLGLWRATPSHHMAEATPFKESDTTRARVLVLHWIVCFSMPWNLTIDTGNKVYGNHAAYCSQANGLVEQFHQHLKTTLQAGLTGHNWPNALPWAFIHPLRRTSNTPQQSWYLMSTS